MDQPQDDTERPPPPPSTETQPTLATTSNAYLSTPLIVPYFINAHGEIKRPEHLIAWWSRIFSFVAPDGKVRRKLRFLCRLFRDALKPPPRWTTFPHPNYPTLKRLMDRLNEMYATLPAVVWEVPTVQGTLSLGMEVRVKYIRWGITSFKDATIQKVNEDETFDIVFDEDDETRKNVPLNEIQIPNVSHSFSSGYLFHVLYVGTLVVLLTLLLLLSFLIYLLFSLLSLLSFLFFLFSSFFSLSILLYT